MAPVSAFVRLALLAVPAWLPFGAARADTQECRVLKSLPVAISSPGNYCPAWNFDQAFRGVGMAILTDRVVPDCRELSIRNPDTGMAGHAGTYAGGVRNRILRDRIGNTPGDSTSTASGIRAQGSGFGHGTGIRDNIVLSPPPLAAPFDGGNYYGMYFAPGTPPGSIVCRDNVVGHFNTDIDADCTKVGNTEF